MLLYIILTAFFKQAVGPTLQTCTTAILSKYSDKGVIFIGDSMSFVELGSYPCIRLNIDQNFPVMLEQQRFYLIQTGNLVRLETFLVSFQKTAAWNASANVLLVNCNLRQVHSVFELFWKFYLVNALVLLDNMDLYTYSPITSGCRLQPKLIGTCSNITSVFQEGQVRTFKGCKFTVPVANAPPLILNWKNNRGNPGIFGALLMESRKILGYSAKLLSNYTNFGRKLPNGSYTQMLEDLYNHKVDYVVGHSANADWAEDFDIAEINVNVGYYFFVPKASQSTVWTNLFKIFAPYTWLGLTLCTAFFLATTYLFRLSEPGRFSEYQFCCLIVWKVIFTCNTTIPTTARYKLILTLWTVCTFLLTSAYQGYMKTILFMPNYDPQIDSMEKLLDSDLKYGGSYNVYDAYLRINNSLSQKFLENFITCDFTMTCVDRSATDKDFAVVKDMRSFMLSYSKYLDDKGKPKLFWFPSEAFSLGVAYLRKGHPIRNRLRFVHAKFLESGLLGKWDVYNALPKVYKHKSNAVKVSLEHLLLAFVMLGIGLIVATLQFTLEIGTMEKSQ